MARKRKKEPGKRFFVTFCDKTNADGVSMHKFATEEKLRRQWVSLVCQRRNSDSWKPGSGHICSHHFTPEDYHDYGMIVAGYASKMLLKKNKMPFRQGKLFQPNSSVKKSVNYRILAMEATWRRMRRDILLQNNRAEP